MNKGLLHTLRTYLDMNESIVAGHGKERQVLHESYQVPRVP